MKNDKKQTGRVNYFMVIAGSYLIYLAYQLFRDAIKGEMTELWLSIGAGVLFTVVGALLLLREWKAYKYGQEHIDDPELLEEACSEETDEDSDGEASEEDEETT